MHYKTIIFVLINLIILSGLAYTGFFFYRKIYLSYNLLRLDPLEESKIDNKLLKTTKDNIDIWLLGDSRIAHWSTNFFSSINANVVNLGIEGQTSRQVLERLEDHLKFGIPDLVVLEVGINDLKIIGLDKTKRNKISELCYHNIISIIELCKINGVRVICSNIFPNGKIEFSRNLVWNRFIDIEIVKINKGLEGYCNKNNIEYFDAFDILKDKNARVKENFQKGFLHINDQAYLELTKQLITKMKIK
jgi:lysophospholipase L1-like esterase